MSHVFTRREFAAAVLLGAVAGRSALAASERRHFLYVATPGIRDYLEYGGHGVLVFDVDAGHKFVKRIPSAGLDDKGKPRNVKGICASAATGRFYVTTTHTLTAYDLDSEAILWERAYPGGCDRMAISLDGSELYIPSFEKDDWYVVKGEDGSNLATISPRSGAHNTLYGPTGRYVYLAGLRSPLLTLADPASRTSVGTVGPFAAPVRPFTVSGDESLAYVNVNGLLGYEIGDIKTGEKVRGVPVPGVKEGPVKRHGCPSHGIGLTPDGREVWVCDAFNQSLHLFSSGREPRYLESIKLRDEPGWVRFGLDGKLAYPSTGEVLDIASRKVVTTLTDELGRAVQSEKMIDLIFEGDKPIAVGDQFGRGIPPT